MKLSEKQIEDVFEVYYKQLLSFDLELLDRQHILESKLRIDLLFRDKEGRNVVLELKKDAITREDIGQAVEYRGAVQNSRVILAAPYIHSHAKISFEHIGLEYLEFDLKEISKLYKSLPKEKEKTNGSFAQIQLPQNVIKTPLRNAPPKDGNIAFKVTFVDSGWCGVCSDKLYQQNCFGKFKKTWCEIQSGREVNCRSEKYQNLTEEVLNLTFENGSPCYDSIAFSGIFSPAVSHGPVNDGKPHRCLEAKMGKLAVFTSREPGTSEGSRFVFMVAPIKDIVIDEETNTEVFITDHDKGVVFHPQHRPKYWDYYYNKRNPERIAWNTGLVRYVDDRICQEIMTATVNGKYKAVKEEYADNAKKLLDLVE